MNLKAYVTTPIYYPNGAPHIGSAYTCIAADVYARFMRLAGHDVKFLTGTDEHGLKLQRAAEEAGESPQTFVNRMSEKFKELEPLLNLSNDIFMRTSSPAHHAAAQAIWRTIAQRGFIYKGNYSGWYCVADEAYYDESELVDGKSPTGRPVEWLVEESYFFKLSAFSTDETLKEKLVSWINQSVQPDSRRNEVLAWVERGLDDFSISRTTFNWGVKVPDDEKHVMYVWFDALTNYLTGLGYPNEKWDIERWQTTLHLVGKDILRFHAIYWPAMLIAADISLPNRVFAHGWWTANGQKMSKSTGNVVDPVALIAELNQLTGQSNSTGGIGADILRYFLLREVPFGQDGDFSRERLIQRYNTELANDLGNLFQRVLAFVNKNCAGKVPPAHSDNHPLFNTLIVIKSDLHSTAGHAFGKTESASFNPTQLLTAIEKCSAHANETMEIDAPWAKKKEGKIAEMEHSLRCLMETMRCITILLAPICPTAAKEFTRLLGLTEADITFENLPASSQANETEKASFFKLQTGAVLPEPKGVFPRIVL